MLWNRSFLLRSRPLSDIFRHGTRPPSWSKYRFNSSTSNASSPHSFVSAVQRPKCAPQILFCIATSAVSFSVAAWWATTETGYLKNQYIGVHAAGHPSTIDLHLIKNTEVLQRVRRFYASILETISKSPGAVKNAVAFVAVSILDPYAGATESKRLCWKVCVLYVGVWMFWRLRPGLFPKYGTHSPLSGMSFTLLTSAFSHFSFLHLFMNCFAFEGFGPSAYFSLTFPTDDSIIEGSAAPHFLAFLISASLFSGLLSHIIRAKITYPRAVSELTTKLSTNPHSSPTSRIGTWAAALSEASATSSTTTFSSRFGKPLQFIRSLFRAKPHNTKSGSNASFSTGAAATGATAAATASSSHVLSRIATAGASGAILSCFTMTMMAFPNAELAFYFPPTYPISIQWAFTALFTFDVFGVLRGWSFFNHHAHLGGYIFGILYYQYGRHMWVWLRKQTDLIFGS